MVAVIPIFFGCTLYSVAVIGAGNVRFATLENAGITLFAVLNGDVYVQRASVWARVRAQTHLPACV